MINLNFVLFDSWVPVGVLRGVGLAVALIALSQSWQYLRAGRGKPGEVLARLMVGLLGIEALSMLLLLSEQLADGGRPLTLGVALLYVFICGVPLVSTLTLRAWSEEPCPGS